MLASSSGRLKVVNEPLKDRELFAFFDCVTYLVDTMQSTLDMIITDATFADHAVVCGVTASSSSRFMCILLGKEVYVLNIVEYFLGWCNLICSAGLVNNPPIAVKAFS